MITGPSGPPSCGVTEPVRDRLVLGLGQPAVAADVQVDPAVLVGVGLARDQDHLRSDHPGFRDDRAARFDHQLGRPAANLARTAPSIAAA